MKTIPPYIAIKLLLESANISHFTKLVGSLPGMTDLTLHKLADIYCDSPSNCASVLHDMNVNREYINWEN